MLVAIGFICALLYIRGGPVSKPLVNQPASPEARAYVSHLALSDVHMRAIENYMRQQVIEVTGKLTNNGPRPLDSVDVYCVFFSVNGQRVYEERLPMIAPNSGTLEPNATRPFRLAFDSLPDTWNQAIPKLVIAAIKFHT
jgi:hypothetical protein